MIWVKVAIIVAYCAGMLVLITECLNRGRKR